jgi:ATP adenylyltransferase
MAPWRSTYIQNVPPDGETACFLCAAWQDSDEEKRLIVHRRGSAMMIMNLYPYTTGHVMVTPGRHVGDLVDLQPAERADLMDLIVLGDKLIQAVLNPQGLNIGMNIGRAAGAGLPGHVHAHLVPRWAGDANFMTVVGQVRVIPAALEQTYRELRGAAAKFT